MLINSQNKQFRTLECHNLRPASDSLSTLVVAGLPTVLAKGDYRPLVADSSLLIAVSNLDIYAFALSESGASDPVLVGSLPSAPRSAILTPAPEGTLLTVMTAKGPWTALRTSASWRVEGLVPRWPAVSLMAEDFGPLSTSVDLADLSTDPARGRISDADRRRITASVREAYDTIRAQARTAGAFVAPVIARARVLDADGNTVHIYPPVILKPAEGDFDSPLAFDSDDRVTFAERTVSMSSFRIRATVCGVLSETLRRRAARLVVDVSPQFFPFGDDFRTTVSFQRTAGKGFMHVAVAFSPSALVASSRHNNTSLMAKAIDRLDSLLVHRTVIDAPFVRAESRVILPDVSRQKQNNSQFSILNSKFSILHSKLPLFCPHSFVASAAATASGAVLWGDIRTLPFEGWSPQCFASRFERKAWRAWAQVVAEDGTAVLWQGEGDDYAPVAFGPLLSYPLAGMKSISLCVEVDGMDPVSVFRSLSSAPSGRFSWSLESDLSAIAPESCDESVAPDLEPMTFPADPALVAAAPVASPLSLSVAKAVVARPSCLLPAPSTGSAWDYGRERFYAFTPEGSLQIVLSSDLRSISATLVNSLSVTSSASVAKAPDGIYIIDGYSLYRLHGKSTVTLVPMLPSRPHYLAYDPLCQELLVATEFTLLHYIMSPDPHRRSLLTPATLRSYTTDPVDPTAWLSAPGGCFVTDASDDRPTRLLDFSRRHSPSKSTAVRWSAILFPAAKTAARTDKKNSNAKKAFTNGNIAFCAGLSPSPARLYELPVFATSIRGDLTLDREYLSALRAPLCRVSVNGRVTHPLRMLVPRVLHLDATPVLTLDALATPDLRLASPTPSIL